MSNEARAMQGRMVHIATEGDAGWFENNPDRRIRIRNAIPMEFSEDVGRAPVGMAWFVLVLEAQPGARLRQPIALPIGFDIGDTDDAALFALFRQAAPDGASDLLKTLRAAKLPGPAGSQG